MALYRRAPQTRGLMYGEKRKDLDMKIKEYWRRKNLGVS